MCTVSFLPLAKNGYILTSNRDEWSGRKTALAPAPCDHNGAKLYYPKDQEAGGTWMACNEKGQTLCLLNGAFGPHERKLPYRLSRGVMLLEVFTYPSPADFVANYNFNGVEPFTLVMIAGQNKLELSELRWDGQQRHFSKKDQTQKHIWSSAMLYTKEVIQQRENWFKDWQEQNKEPRQEDILKFHCFTGVGDTGNDLIMSRENGVRTQSVTSILYDQAQHHITHRDILKGEDFKLVVRDVV